MNILTIPFSHGYFKPLGGAQNRFSNLINQLSSDNNIILLESHEFNENQLKTDKIKNIYCFKDIKILGRTLFLFKDLNIGYILAVFKILKDNNIDIIQITHPGGAIIIKVLIKLFRKNTHIIYDSHNVETNFMKDIFQDNPEYSSLEKFVVTNYLSIIEKITFKFVFNHVTCVCENDRDFFIDKYKIKKENITVVPSGCKLPELNKKVRNEIKEELNIHADKVILFFHGLYSHKPNKDAFKLIIEEISENFIDNPDVFFLLGGTGTPKIKKRNLISLGFIEDLDKILSIVDIAIVPLEKGGGTKLKILDYLSYGIPVLTTKTGAEGLEVVDKKNIWISDDVNESFIESLTYLIKDREIRNKIGPKARELAENLYDWNKIGIKLTELYGDIHSKDRF